MPSIYGKLFKRRETEARRPLEDFLTEALADLLNRAPREQVINFVSAHLLPDEARSAWNARVGGGAGVGRLLWTTQRPAPDSAGRKGFLDLSLEIEEGGGPDGERRPLLVVESKVAARLGARRSLDPDEALVSPLLSSSADAATGRHQEHNQLHLYGRWLARAVADDPFAWKGAIVFLTHASLPPPDFGGRGSGAYGVPWQRTCAWHRVWRWLSDAAGAPSGADGEAPAWRVLAGELAEFLMENGMASDTMTAHDLAAAAVYSASADRVRESFKRARSRLGAFMSEVGTRRANPRPEFEAESRLVWDFTYLAKQHVSAPENGYYVAWGIRFPGEATRWAKAEPPLPATAHAFLALECDGDVPLAFPPSGPVSLPVGSSRTGEGALVVARPLHEFPAAPDEMTEAWAEWVSARAEELKPLLRSLTRQGA